jgi:hypothetical protein
MLHEIWEETGNKPDSLSNRPTLKELWITPYNVWRELSGSRNYTAGGLAEIPFSEFFLWALAHRYSLDEMASMWEDVHVIDVEWLSLKFEKDKLERDSKQRSAKS